MFGSPLTKHQDLRYEDVETTEDVEAPSSVGGLASKSATTAWLYMLSMANFGIQSVWALASALITPYFSGALGADAVVSHMVWILGPLSGLFVAPVVGYMSDGCKSNLGKRRPFVLAGAAGGFVGLFLLAFAGEFGNNALVIAVFAFGLMDVAVNVTSNPVRALQGDLVSSHEQHRMQSAAVVAGSLGELVTNYAVQRYDDPVANARTLFTLVAILYFCTNVAVVIIAREDGHVTNEDHGNSYDLPTRNSPRYMWDSAVRYMRGVPVWLWRVGGIYALGFFAFFCQQPYFSAWLGSSVLNGDPSAKQGSAAHQRYQRGVSAMGRAGMARSLISFALAIGYPRLAEEIPAHILLQVSFGAHGILLLVCAGTQSVLVAEVVVALYAVPLTMLASVPAALTMKRSNSSNRAKNLAALSFFCVIPQLIDTLYTGLVSKLLGEAWVMRIGALWSLGGAFFASRFLAGI